MLGFNDIAKKKTHLAYLEDKDIFSHTADAFVSKKIVKGYLFFLKNIICFNLEKTNNCIDLGCGAANITNEFLKKGFNIKGLEYSDDAMNMLKRNNPQLNLVQGDMTKFKEDNSYNFIFSREVYLITRVNSYLEQHKIVSNIIDSLKSGGIFMLVGSDVNYPQCMDYDLIIKNFRKDHRIKFVSDKYYEILITKFHQYIFGKISYKICELLFLPLIWYKKRYQMWASQYIIVFEKK
ncbi:MAG: hypothetical protein C0626_05810 [Arcobacter sp.]|uniref:class I SAM-dependent methyltransferase n=1 Tax=uncultured Arcobacter sp. TaxID=165434 RepID=UPI000CB338B7|nr:methyltransferase domain-containing protein [uncultured Arcobacter sp.]PLY10489.1 MAG: hypothetical protein C0626_05810 [Arcobacter sp.]